ncbi:MAG: hypothetical protein M1833_002440 [Piccolia ochrophora]|nr:MAG: hypothetical protein M1833_002440 [Piccolia ochrophora]
MKMLQFGQRQLKFISKRLVLSYVLDWVIVVAAGIVGAVLSRIEPAKRAFNLANPDLSLPYAEKEKVPPAALVAIVLLFPAAVILLVCLFFIPGPTVSKDTPRSLIWRRKLWELNTGWLGLALSLAATFLITDGMKNLFGKPRPDMLSRCDPDLENIEKYVVGGLGDKVNQGITLVSAAICQATGAKIDDGFRSFPSGHSSSAWAGMLYLTLFLCSKFAIAIPFLAPKNIQRTAVSSAFPRFRHHQTTRQQNSSEASSKGYSGIPRSFQDMEHDEGFGQVPLRNQAAAPPNYLLVFALIPIAVAIYICATRWSDYRHFGFDIIFGSLMGFAIAWFSFRWYHLPIRQGAGWSWGARSRERSFWVGVGVPGYVGEEGWTSGDGEEMVAPHDTDVEAAGAGPSSAFMGPGIRDSPSMEQNDRPGPPPGIAVTDADTAYRPQQEADHAYLPQQEADHAYRPQQEADHAYRAQH